MARTGWLVEKRVADVWVDDGLVNRPNENFERGNLSTMVKVPLANGKLGYMTFTNKSIEQPLPFSWLFTDKDFVDKINDYVINNDELRITDHFDKEYKGMFTECKPIEITGQYPSKFDMMAVFEIMPDL